MTSITVQHPVPMKAPYEKIFQADTDTQVTLTPGAGRKWSKFYSSPDGIVAAADKTFDAGELAAIDKPYYVMYDETTKQVDFFVVSRRPVGIELTSTGAYYDNIIFTLLKGTQVFQGEYTHGDLTLDSDGDGIPNFIQPARDTSLVGYWPFESIEGGKTLDLSGSGNTATVTGATVTTGKINNGLLFDATGEYVLLPNTLDTSTTYTISMWINSTTPAGTTYMINSPTAGALRLYTAAANNTKIIHQDSGSIDRYSANIGITYDAWNLYTITYDGAGTFNIYRNGAYATNLVIAIIKALNAAVRISNPSASFNGVMDEVRIWNRVLSAGEIKQLYGQQLLRTGIGEIVNKAFMVNGAFE